MIILTLRTDKPEAEIGVFNNASQLSYEVWTAHRQLAESIHTKIKAELQKHDNDWSDIQGIVVYKGPGSFTGLRIGLTVANTLADSLGAKIVGETGENWCKQGLQRLINGEDEHAILPNYGSEPHITRPKT